METFLLCAPDFFCVDYSINPWMIGEKIDIKLAMAQWHDLEMTIKHLGADVKNINPVEGLPDMVFAANSGIVHQNTVVMSRMKYTERKDEIKYYRSWFVKNNYNIVDLIPGITFEGCGDALVHKSNLIGGYGYRSDLKALEITAGALNLSLHSLKLVDPRFYHLDTCFCKVSETHAIYYPDAIDKEDVKKLKGIIELIPVTELDARLFMCNSMLVNNVLLIPSRDAEIAAVLRNKFGIKTCTVNVSEFLKSGGSIQCLSLKI